MWKNQFCVFINYGVWEPVPSVNWAVQTGTVRVRTAGGAGAGQPAVAVRISRRGGDTTRRQAPCRGPVPLSPTGGALVWRLLGDSMGCPHPAVPGAAC